MPFTIHSPDRCSICWVALKDRRVRPGQGHSNPMPLVQQNGRWIQPDADSCWLARSQWLSIFSQEAMGWTQGHVGKALRVNLFPINHS